MDNFDPAKVTQLLVDYGLKKQEGQGRDPLVTYIWLRMPNRGGAEGGTPELYFTDPDGLAIQLQDVVLRRRRVPGGSVSVTWAPRRTTLATRKAEPLRVVELVRGSVGSLCYAWSRNAMISSHPSASRRRGRS